jgi:hypothetical protein
VYAEQGLKQEELAVEGGADESSEETSDETSDVKPPAATKQRRSSSGSSATVMSGFLPPPAPPKLRAADWFAKVMANDEQVAAVKLLLPASAGEPSTLLLAMIDDESLADCGLSKIQIAAWKKLAAAESI